MRDATRTAATASASASGKSQRLNMSTTSSAVLRGGGPFGERGSLRSDGHVVSRHAACLLVVPAALAVSPYLRRRLK